MTLNSRSVITKLFVRILPAPFKIFVFKALRMYFLRRLGLVEIGKFTYGKPKVYFWDHKSKLKIGNFTSIAENCTFILGGEHRTDWISTFPFTEFTFFNSLKPLITGFPATKGDIEVGNDVWIGHGCLILSGVKIGNGAVIGAGSVVTRDVDNFAIVAGNPAKLIRYRFDDETINYIINLNWWNLDNETIRQMVPKLMTFPFKD